MPWDLFFRIFPCQFACFEKSDLEKKCTSLTCFLFILHVRCINPVWLFSEKAEFRCLIDFLDFFGTSQNQGEYHKITDNLVICGFSWVSILEGQITQNKIQRQPPRTVQTTKGKKNSPVSISVFISMSSNHICQMFFSSNCPLLTTTPWDQNLGTFPQTASNLYHFILVMDQLTCQVPTGSSEICVCIYKCVYIMCVWVCLKIMDFPKTVLEMASFVSNQLDLRVSNFWMPMYGILFQLPLT